MKLILRFPLILILKAPSTQFETPPHPEAPHPEALRHHHSDALHPHPKASLYHDPIFIRHHPGASPLHAEAPPHSKAPPLSLTPLHHHHPEAAPLHAQVPPQPKAPPHPHPETPSLSSPQHSAHKLNVLPCTCLQTSFPLLLLTNYLHHNHC